MTDWLTRTRYAHRGLFENTGPAPENSLAAFRAAIQNGYGVELDVQAAADGAPVVFHDFPPCLLPVLLLSIKAQLAPRSHYGRPPVGGL